MAAAPTGAVVGFDLDMTLIDSRQAILASFAAVAAESGVPIDLAAVDSRLGVKLEDELSHWFPPEGIEPAVAIYRRHYPLLAGPRTSVLPGARAALAAVRAAGDQVVVISAKFEPTVRRTLDDLGLGPAIDAIHGGLHGPEKGEVLARLGAAVYVGDSPPDMGAAVASGAFGVGVATGSFTHSDLRAAGAGVIMSSLEEFPAWFARFRANGAVPGR